MSLTLAQLSFGNATVYAVCGNCRHFSAPEQAMWARRKLWYVEITKIEPRLWCTVCKKRRGKLTTQRPYVGQRVCPRCLQPMWK